MNKKKLWLLLPMALIAAQYFLTADFLVQAPRIEVHTPKESYDVTDNNSFFGAQEIASELTANYIKNYEIRDLRDASRVVKQFMDITLFIGAFVFGLGLVRYVCRDAAKLYRQIADTMRVQMLSHYIFENSDKLLRKLIKYAVLIFLAELLVICFSFELYVPQRYLPPEYFFDVGFYIELLKARADMVYGYPQSEYHMAYEAITIRTAGLCGATILAMLGIYCGTGWRRKE